jgi:predicted LPLAT superfamily acyltransferase
MSFGEGILDKLAVWQGDIALSDVRFKNRDKLEQLLAKQQGGVIIGSHLGNLEICRALSLQKHDVKINVLMHTAHAQKFNQMLKRAGSDSQVEIIQVSDVSPATAMMLNDKIQAGEFIVITGDRTPLSGQSNSSQVSFMGKPALFPQGPFVLAAILKCPVLIMFCLRSNTASHRYDISLTPFKDKIILPRKERHLAATEYIQDYANILADTCQQAPLQWYNFHSIWADAAIDSPTPQQQDAL